MIEKIKKTLFRVIANALPNCKNITELVSRSLEVKLSRHEKLLLKFHLWSCVACSRYLSQLKFMSKVFTSQEHKFKQKAVPVLSANAAERLKKKLKTTKLLLIFVLINFLF